MAPPATPIPAPPVSGTPIWVHASALVPTVTAPGVLMYHMVPAASVPPATNTVAPSMSSSAPFASAARVRTHGMLLVPSVASV